MGKSSCSREKEVAEFELFLNQAIWYLSKNAVRKADADELRNGGISLETVDEAVLERLLFTEDKYGFDDGIELEITTMKITVNSEQVKHLLHGLTERETQVVILHCAFGYDNKSIGRLLGISADRARSYHYQGMKKVRRKAGKNGGKEKKQKKA